MLVVLWHYYDNNTIMVFANVEGFTWVGLLKVFFKIVLMYRAFPISLEQLGVIPSDTLMQNLLALLFVIFRIKAVDLIRTTS